MPLLPTASVVFHTLRHALAGRALRAWRSAAHRERKLRVGVDIRPFYEPLTGVGWYLYYLLHELARRDDVELYLFGDARVTDDGPFLHADLPPNAHLCTFDLRGQSLSRLSRPMTAGAYVLWMNLADCDVFFGANYFLPRLHGAVARRRVVTVHDLTYKRFPELLQKETLENLDRQMQREVAVADAIVCVSESTRRDLLRYYDADPARVHAILSGLGTPAVAQPIEGLPPRYILFVSTIEPRKNLGTLIDAYERLRDRGLYDGSLVVVGKVGWKSESLVPRLRGRGIVHLDYVPAPQLATIYERAEAFVFPSIYEGFGFPLLEAMARGVPSIAARSSSLPEIGGDAALYFDPLDVDALTAQLTRVLGDATLRAELAARGKEQTAKFQWKDAAAETLKVLRRAAER
ncbi:MAG TPA: glycosyltransferase family 1 protein [Thermoanaerobaculia bacterium]|jgi:glycosyltransferase involved in cell wall biosynthesis|nr:glycosyltransferase family 1 protein [Thermoanaerobaculia bacterium]